MEANNNDNLPGKNKIFMKNSTDILLFILILISVIMTYYLIANSSNTEKETKKNNLIIPKGETGLFILNNSDSVMIIFNLTKEEDRVMMGSIYLICKEKGLKCATEKYLNNMG